MYRTIVLKIRDTYYHIDVKVGLFNVNIIAITEADSLCDWYGEAMDFEVACNKIYSLRSHIRLIADRLKHNK